MNSQQLDKSVLVYGKMLAGKSSSCQQLGNIYSVAPIDTGNKVTQQESVVDLTQLIQEQTGLLGSSELTWEGFGWSENRCLQGILQTASPQIISAGGRTMQSKIEHLFETQNDLL